MNEPFEPQDLGDLPEVSITLLSLGPSCPPRHAGDISVEGEVLTGSRLFTGLRSCWELNQDDNCATSVEMFVFMLPGNSLGPMLAACVFIYYLFINHKSGKDLRKLTIKDTNSKAVKTKHNIRAICKKREHEDQGQGLPLPGFVSPCSVGGTEGCRSCPVK